MADSGDEEDDQVLAKFLESEILQEEEEEEEEEKKKKKNSPQNYSRASKRPCIEQENSSGIFLKIPPELFHHIFKFLSSEDLIACSLVCRFMNSTAADERLWRRLYCMRWGMGSPTAKLRACAWKQLYIQNKITWPALHLAYISVIHTKGGKGRRDQEDMVEFVRNTPQEFKEYYIQMQAAKRSQTPVPSQVNDDRVILDRTVGDQVSIWRSSRGFTDDSVLGHVCSGRTCSYSQIGDVFLCEKTGRVHVCDDTCREVVLDQSSGLMVCTVSGQCFDRWLSPEEESDTEQQDDEPCMGSGRFARAYQVGYNCADEKELEAALRSC